MKHIFNITLFFTTLLLSTASGFAHSSEGEFMQVAAERVTVDDKRCYLIKKGYSRKDTTNWEPFCGEFTTSYYSSLCDEIVNFYYVEGYSRTLLVKKYDPQADTIHVRQEILRDSDPCNKMEKLRQLEAKRDSTKASRLPNRLFHNLITKKRKEDL